MTCPRCERDMVSEVYVRVSETAIVESYPLCRGCAAAVFGFLLHGTIRAEDVGDSRAVSQGMSLVP